MLHSYTHTSYKVLGELKSFSLNSFKVMQGMSAQLSYIMAKQIYTPKKIKPSEFDLKHINMMRENMKTYKFYFVPADHDTV